MGVDIRPASRYLPLINKLVRNSLEVSLRVQGQSPHPHQGKIIFVDNTVDPYHLDGAGEGRGAQPRSTLLPWGICEGGLDPGRLRRRSSWFLEAVVEAQEGARVLVVDDQNKVRAAIVKPLDTYQGLVGPGVGAGGRGKGDRQGNSARPPRTNRRDRRGRTGAFQPARVSQRGEPTL